MGKKNRNKGGKRDRYADLYDDSGYDQYENDEDYQYGYQEELDSAEFVDTDQDADYVEEEDEEPEDDRTEVYGYHMPEREPEPEPKRSREPEREDVSVKAGASGTAEKKEKSAAAEESAAWQEILQETGADAEKKEKGPGFGDKLKGWSSALGGFLKKKKSAGSEAGEEGSADEKSEAQAGPAAETAADASAVENAQETPTVPKEGIGKKFMAFAGKTAGGMRSIFARKKKDPQESADADASDEDAIAAVEESVKNAARSKSGIARAVEQQRAASRPEPQKPEKAAAKKSGSQESPASVQEGVPGIPSKTPEQLARENRQTYLILGSAFVGLTALCVLAVVLFLFGGSKKGTETAADPEEVQTAEGAVENTLADGKDAALGELSDQLSLPAGTLDGTSETAKPESGLLADNTAGGKEETALETPPLSDLGSSETDTDPEMTVGDVVKSGTPDDENGTLDGDSAGKTDFMDELEASLDDPDKNAAPAGENAALEQLAAEGDENTENVDDSLAKELAAIGDDLDRTAKTESDGPLAIGESSEESSASKVDLPEEMSEAPQFPKVKPETEVPNELLAGDEKDFESNVWNESKDADLLDPGPLEETLSTETAPNDSDASETDDSAADALPEEPGNGKAADAEPAKTDETDAPAADLDGPKNAENEVLDAPEGPLAVPETDLSTPDLGDLQDPEEMEKTGDLGENDLSQTLQTPQLDSKEEAVVNEVDQAKGEIGEKNSRFVDYVVLDGETFWKISEKFYGSPAYKDALARYNRDNLSISGELEAGMKISIPALEYLRRSYGAYCPRDPVTLSVVGRGSEGVSVQYYIVQEGDTVTAIAEKCLGDAANWPAIRRKNPDKITTLGILPEGIQLIIPTETSPGSGVWE